MPEGQENQPLQDSPVDAVQDQTSATQQQAAPMPPSGNQKHIKKLVGALLAIIILLLGVIMWVIIQNSEDETMDNSANSETAQTEETEQQPESSAPTATLSSDYLSNYTIMDEAYGTETTVVVDEEAGTRTITSNALPNHDTGDFPNNANPNTISAQSASYNYTLNPVFVGAATETRTPGVALNGVKLEPGTAETFTCSSGETYRVEAIQDLTSLGLDFNNAHVQPTGEYHYHGISTMMTEVFDNGNDLVHVAFAADGHMIYYSKSGAYKPSYRLGTDLRTGTNCEYSLGDRVDVEYTQTKDGAITSDWDYVDGLGQLDECNGVMIGDEYVYIMTDEFPYISRCLMGEVSGSAPGGGGGGAPPSNGGQNGPPSGMPPQ